MVLSFAENELGNVGVVHNWLVGWNQHCVKHANNKTLQQYMFYMLNDVQDCTNAVSSCLEHEIIQYILRLSRTQTHTHVETNDQSAFKIENAENKCFTHN